jgi:DUF971 family protein
MKSTNPRKIDVSLSTGVNIDWTDAHRSEYSLEYLRGRCPCATCANSSGKPAEPQNPFQMFKKVLKMDAVEPVGRYALQFKWNDGHSSGIYSFDYLRDICPCPQCRSEKS